MPARPAHPVDLRTVSTLLLLTCAGIESAGAQSVTISGSVRHGITNAPIGGATLRALPGGASCMTDGNGRCRLVVQLDSVTVTARAVGYAPASMVVVRGAPASVTFALQASAARLDELVSLGTRSEERTVSQSTVPVDVLSQELLEATGAVETWQQLQRLVPSLNVPHIPIGDNHMRPVTLRGLAPHHVLVLVNGKRRHPAAPLLAGPSVPATSFTDLSVIPVSAIARIEVLRDGAAAQYGSDAIGGVVNVVLKSGVHQDLRVASGTVLSREGGRSFSDGEHITAGGSYGAMTRGGAYLMLSAELQDRNGTNRAYPDRRPQYFPGAPGNNAPPRVSSYLGNGEMRSATGFMTAGIPVGRSTEAYAFAGAASRSGSSPDAFFRRPLDGRTVRAIHPDGFLPVVASDIDDRSAVVGLRGTHTGWHWDVSGGWAENRIGYAVDQSNNASLGAASPTQFDAGRLGTGQWTGNLDLARGGRVGTLPAHIAIGAAFRQDRYRITPGEPDSWRDGDVRILDGPAAGQPAAVGAQGMTGFRPVDAVRANRHSGAIYVEGDIRPLPGLLLQSAVRTERYSDVGSTLNGKLAARVELGAGTALRGSISTGFRAPPLTQQHFASTRTVYQPINGVNTVFLGRTFPVNSPEARIMGATPLRPELAENLGAGVVVDRPRWPLVTLDVYQIRIADRIRLAGTVTDTSIIRRFAESGMQGLAGGNYFTNGVDTRTRGLDVVVSHAVQLHRTGVLRFLGGYNRTSTVVTRVAPPPEQLAAFGAVLFNRTSRGIIEQGQPRETIALTLTYQASRLGLSLHNQRSGPTAQLDQANPAADQVVRARWITDARVAYQVQRRLQVAVSVANLFDTYPDEWLDFPNGLAATGPSMQGIFRHPGALSPFGMNGRMVNVQVGYR